MNLYLLQYILVPIGLQNVFDFVNNYDPKIFFSLQLDASNRKNVKLLPISIQFYTVQAGVQNYLIHFCVNSNESSEGMFNMVECCLKKI